jgi:tetratricopeptide (TPR) repeat protein
MTLPNPNRFFSWLIPGLLISVAPVLPGSLASPLPVLAQSSTNSAVKAEADQLLQQGIEARSQIKGGLFGISANGVFPPLWKALKLYQEIKDRRGEINALNNLGISSTTWGSPYDKLATDYYQQALAIAHEIKDQKSEVDILNNLGVVHNSQRDYRQAVDYYQKGLTIARKIQYRMGEVDALNRLGIVYKVQKDYQQAINYYQQSLALAREIKDREGERTAMGNLKLAYEAQGDYRKAQEYDVDRESKKIQIESNLSSEVKRCRETKNRRCEMFAFRGAANNYSRLLVYSKAIEYFQQGFKIARETEDRQQESFFLMEIAGEYAVSENYLIAVEYYQKALAISQEISDINTEQRAWAGLGEAHQALGKSIDADEYSDIGASLPIVRSIPRNRGAIYRDFNKGLALFKVGKLAEAEKVLFDAIQAQESWAQRLTSGDYKKLTYYYHYDNAAKYYSILQQVLIAQNKIESALEIAERGRARALAEFLEKRFSLRREQSFNPSRSLLFKKLPENKMSRWLSTLKSTMNNSSFG